MSPVARGAPCAASACPPTTRKSQPSWPSASSMSTKSSSTSLTPEPTHHAPRDLRTRVARKRALRECPLLARQRCHKPDSLFRSRRVAVVDRGLFAQTKCAYGPVRPCLRALFWCAHPPSVPAPSRAAYLTLTPPPPSPAESPPPSSARAETTSKTADGATSASRSSRRATNQGDAIDQAPSANDVVRTLTRQHTLDPHL